MDDLLAAIEEREGISILYAVESGSRVWGTSSTRSDYDLRFIYKYDLHSYISLQKPKDTRNGQSGIIEWQGWDIFKALQLFRKSNSTLYEWLYSPIIYKEKSDIVQQLRDLCEVSYSFKKMGYHYYHMAQQNQKVMGQVLTNHEQKGIIQLIRGLVAVRWLEQHQFPPIPLTSLFSQHVPSDVLSSIQQLIIWKRENRDRFELPTNLEQFIHNELGSLAQRLPMFLDNKVDQTALNRLLWKEFGL